MRKIAILSKVQACFRQDSKKRYYYFIYTILFLILAFLCFSWFIFSGKSLVWFTDAWRQHFRALVYYAKYLRDIIRHLIYDHRLVIPEWDYHIGEGSDIVNALHYYVIGDPIALLSVFVPTKYMHYFYSASCILRLYLAGIAFSELCFGTGVLNRYGVLAGSLSYAFSMWGLYDAARHPYFLNPMIYFPLMILGIEKIIHKKKPYLFIFSAAISAASNFYFFYMIVILAVVYALLRLGFMYRRDLRKGVGVLLQLGGYAVTGVCMAGVLLLPVLAFFLQESRLSSQMPFRWLYPLYYYSMLPGAMISNNDVYWLCIGLTAPVVLGVFLFLRSSGKSALLKVLFALCTVIMLFPIGGRILNGMSYVTNRWVWAFILLCAYILAQEWEHLLSLSRKEWLSLFVFGVVYYGLCLFLDKSRSLAAYSIIIMMFIALAVLREKDPDSGAFVNLRSGLLIALVMAGGFNTALWQFSPAEGNYIQECLENSKIVDDWENNEARLVRDLADSPYDRYSGRGLTLNANMSMGISGTQYYWSISNPFMNEYRTDLEMREQYFHSYEGYDDRTAALALAAVKYYAVSEYSDQKGLPYGYELIDTLNANPVTEEELEALRLELGVDELSQDQSAKIEWLLSNKYDIYENRYALPLGYCCDSYIPSEKWEALDAVQKQQILLNTAVLEDDNADLVQYTGTEQDYTVSYEASCVGADITATDAGYVTTANDRVLTLDLSEMIRSGETYVEIKGLQYTPTSEYDLYFGNESVDPLNLYNETNWNNLTSDRRTAIKRDKDYREPTLDAIITFKSDADTSKNVIYRQPESPLSSGRHDYIVNLGYLEEPVTSIKITFPTRGIYTFDSLKVYRVGMEDYPEKIEKLQESTLQNIRMDTDSVYGDIRTDETKLLCIAIPYLKGWTGYIDGTKTELLCVNEHYLGMIVPAGSHEISLHYDMPFKKIGLLITVLGFVILGIIWRADRGSDGGKKGVRPRAGSNSKRTGK